MIAGVTPLPVSDHTEILSDYISSVRSTGSVAPSGSLSTRSLSQL